MKVGRYDTKHRQQTVASIALYSLGGTLPVERCSRLVFDLWPRTTLLPL